MIQIGLKGRHDGIGLGFCVYLGVDKVRARAGEQAQVGVTGSEGGGERRCEYRASEGERCSVSVTSPLVFGSNTTESSSTIPSFSCHNLHLR